MYRPRVFRFFCSHTRMISSPTILYLSSRFPSFMLLTRSGAATVSRTSCLTRFSLHEEGNAVLPGTEVPDPWLPRICPPDLLVRLDDLVRPRLGQRVAPVVEGAAEGGGLLGPLGEALAGQHDAERVRAAPVSEALAAQQ